VRRRSEEQYLPNGGINNVESLAGKEIASYFPNLNAGVEGFSPTVRLFIDQDALEPILRERAQKLGARLRYRTQCTALQQDGDGVTATLLDLEDGTESTVRARYVVAADGNRSPTREQLGVAISSWSTSSATPRGPRSSPPIRRRHGPTWPRPSTSRARWNCCAPPSASPTSR
jgi:2-polyprenyl-6-methoxyphenol hydroxylase-like FAD-dependent oxidoreductase